MTFTSPLALLLLLLLPLFAWIGRLGQDKILSHLLRLVITLCLILSLAGLEIVRGGDELAVVFLVDVSDSMSDEAVAAELDYVRQAMTGMGPDDQAAIVLFGADALVERAMQPGSALGLVTSAPVTTQTDLGEAIRLGLALFPSGAARRMVILSDGAQTTGDALKAAEFAAAAGAQVVVVPFVVEPGAEAIVTAIQAPASLRPGERFDLNVSIQSSQPTRATLRVLADGEILYEQPHDLRRGNQTFSLPLVSAAQSGFLRYTVEILPQDDTFYQNNRLYAFSKIEGPPRILMAAPPPGETLPGGATRPDEHSTLRAALQAAGYQVDFVLPADLPADLAELAQYNALVLVNVPARELSIRQMETAQAYVRDLGGGLLVVGGPTSYGVGGYFETPLEAALPVDMQIKDEQRRPSLAIVFIIDHSGSMSETSGGVNKLELAKEAAARSVDLLFPTDRVGVIQFDDSAAWVVPMTDLSNPGVVKSAIGSIRIGGGTDILAGLQAMARVLPDDPAKVKHVILLTDGGADPAGIPELVQKLYTENGITLSTVAVGRDAAPFLKDLAELGNGRYHFTTDPASIPSIFTEETTLATRAYIEEGLFAPQRVNASPILSGLESLPPLYGYIASSPKELAQVILAAGGTGINRDDPLLAAWQYGLGRSVAFTSDATGRWGKDWVSWSNYAAFWAQAARYVLGEMSAARLQMDVSLRGETARLSLEARGPGGDFLNGYQVTASVVAPESGAQTVTLRQTAPGRYEAEFRPSEQGVYLFRFDAEGENGAFAETLGWALPYSPEYRDINPNPDLLARIAALTGGKVASADPVEVFTHNLKAPRASRPIWPWLIALAAILLPFDVAARRLILTRQDLTRIREMIQARFLLQKPPKEKITVSSPSMEALRKAKQRSKTEADPTPAATPPQPPILPSITEKSAGSQMSDLSKKEETPASTASALLAKKRQRK
jgi:Mg-chelatase subunit ChlD